MRLGARGPVRRLVHRPDSQPHVLGRGVAEQLVQAGKDEWLLELQALHPRRVAHTRVDHAVPDPVRAAVREEGRSDRRVPSANHLDGLCGRTQPDLVEQARQ